MTKEQIKKKIEEKQERLTAYKEQELRMLKNGIQSYGIGSRNLARYSFDLEKLKNTITELETEIDTLENQLNGGGQRKSVGVVIRDW